MRNIAIGVGILGVLAWVAAVFYAMPKFNHDEIVNTINEYRMDNGSQPLRDNIPLSRAAKLILKKFIEHDNVEMDVENVARLTGYDPYRINKIIVGNVSDIKGALRNIKMHPRHNDVLLAKRFFDVGEAHSQQKKAIVIVLGTARTQ
jgi:hypothetical protein